VRIEWARRERWVEERDGEKTEIGRRKRTQMDEGGRKNTKRELGGGIY